MDKKCNKRQAWSNDIARRLSENVTLFIINVFLANDENANIKIRSYYELV